MASRLAHEFNQMLGVIGKETGVMVSNLKPDHPLQGFLEGDIPQRTRAAALTAQLLALRIQETTTRDALSLGPSVEAMRETLGSLLSDPLDLQVKREMTTALVSHDRLEQVRCIGLQTRGTRCRKADR